jgi:hypothetical protein
MKRLGFALSTLVLGTVLSAQEAPAEEACAPKACRPLFSTSAGLAEPGVLELEFGAQKIRNRDRSETNYFPTQLNLGVCEWFDVRLGWSGPTLRKDSQGEVKNGGGDPVFGGQALALKQDAAGLDLGLAYWHKVPRASVAKGIGTGKHDDTLLVTASRVCGSWAIDLNAGANWVGHPEAEGRVRQGALSLCVTCAVAPCWNLTLDTYALAGTELGPRAVSSILALSHDISPNLCVDIGVEAGLTQGAPRMSLNAGLVWRMGRLWTAK